MKITLKNKQRTINFFNNIHMNEDIYIIASGKSLDFLDSNFFDNKITIGINQVYKKVNCKYYIRKEHTAIKEVLDNIDKSSYLFVSNHNSGEYMFQKIINNYNDNRIIVYDHIDNIRYNNNKITRKIFNGNKLVSSTSTITTAIHLAKNMGAKNIILVGHDCCCLNGESNFTNYHTNESLSHIWCEGNAQDAYNNWLKSIEETTIHIKKILYEHYGINVLSLNPFINFNLEGNIINNIN